MSHVGGPAGIFRCLGFDLGASMSGSDIRVIFIFLAIRGGLSFLFQDEVRQLASGLSKGPAQSQVTLDAKALGAVYDKLKIEPLSPAISASPPIAGALKDLINSLCDKTAI